MSNRPNVIFKLNYVQSADKINGNAALRAQYGEKRRYYSCGDGGDMDYLRYVDKGTREADPVIEQDYVGYSGNSEKGSGIFNGKGLMGTRERFELRKELQKTKSTIWHGLISFEEAFGKKYCGNTLQAQRLMSREFPRFLKSAGFDPDKIVWFAGLHTNTDNSHIHLSFFECEPSRYLQRGRGVQFSNGKIAPRHFDSFKVAAELRLTDISSQIAASRKEVTELFGNVLHTQTNRARYHDELYRKLARLTNELPVSGRLSYDSENMQELKPQIKEIVDLVIKRNGRLYYSFEDYCARVKDKDRQTLEALKENKIRPADWPRFMVSGKYLEDIYRRLGNQIIGSVRVIKNRERQAKSRLAQKHIRRRTVLDVMQYALRIDSEVEREAMEAFEEYLERLESEKISIKGGVQSEME